MVTSLLRRQSPTELETTYPGTPIQRKPRCTAHFYAHPKGSNMFFCCTEAKRKQGEESWPIRHVPSLAGHIRIPQRLRPFG